MATDLTAITDTLNVNSEKGPRQFQGLFDVIAFKATLTDTTMAADTAATCDLDVTGAALGDFVLIASGADLTDGILVAQVSAANVVTVTIWNPEGTDAITPFAGGVAIKGVVLKPKANVFDNF